MSVCVCVRRCVRAAAPPPEGAPKFNFTLIFLTNSIDLLQG